MYIISNFIIIEKFVKKLKLNITLYNYSFWNDEIRLRKFFPK